MTGLDAAARADLYAFFSRLFLREVDDAFARALQAPGLVALLPRFVDSPEAKGALDPGFRATHLDADFAHVTIVNLVPYESFFVRDDGNVEAGLANPLVRYYREFGFEADLAAARALSPDHLGIELEFMATLARQEHDATREGRRDVAVRAREVRRRFVETHLGAWAPVYLLAVQRNAHSLLYRDGAEALLEFILTDHAALRGAA